MGKNISRRSFLKGSALAAVGAGMLGVMPAAAEEKPGIDWVAAADVVVVGGGGAGFAGAIEAARAGSTVLILEKCAYCGGDTLRSGGMIMVGGSEYQKAMGVDDSPEKFAEHELAYCADAADRDMVREMCLNSLDSLKFMTDMGREYTVVSEMHPVAGYDDMNVWAPRTHWTGDETRTGHFAILQQESLKYDNIKVMNNIEVAHLITDDAGAVIGVKDTAGKCYRANKGVLLATASFGTNKEMSKRYNAMNYWALCLEEALEYPSPNGQHTLNTGDGIRMAQEIGADLALSPANCISDCTSPTFGSIYGAILVNNQGKRFVQENAHWGYLLQMVYNEAVQTNATGSDKIHFWYIMDESTLNKNFYYQVALTDMRLTVTEAYQKHIKKADTIEALAEQCGLPKDALAASVARWNEMVDKGEDTDFRRKNVEGYTNDFEKIGEGPYYALPLAPNTMGSFGGLRTNNLTQVLNTAGKPIDRLYAAGAIMSGMYTGAFYNACGWSVLGTVHWGRKAGAQIHALTPWTTEAVVAADAAAAKSVEDAIAGANGSYNAGAYTASANGMAGDVPVTVEFSDKAILSVTVGENKETVGIGTIAIEQIPEKILLAQNADVDVIAGATLTSAAILNAVNQCIAQAKK